MKNILILGATSGIAHACARRWASPDHHLLLVGRDKEKLNEVATDLQVRGAGKVSALTLDLADSIQISQLMPWLEEHIHQLDIALIAHGTLPDQQRCQDDIAYAAEQFSINGGSAILLLTLLAQKFEIQRCGSIAVISSVAGDRGRPSNYLYGAAKAAVSTFTSGLAAKMAKIGVQVLDIKPGFVATPMTRGLPLPKALVVSADVVAQQIVAAIGSRKTVIYTPRFWSLIMLIIRLIPRPVFNRLKL